jgi:hypothetical protein
LISSLSCQRNTKHKIVVIFDCEQIHSTSEGLKLLAIDMVKVGQKPSHADISNGVLASFALSLEGQDRAEFLRANGLAAHGVHIGAFVYLRRVFDRLITRAQERAQASDQAPNLDGLRMHEKIKALDGCLPPFLIKNSQIYSFLSNGIHELSEDSCGKMYEIMKSSIIFMLEQEREIKLRQTREQELDKLVAQLSSQQ